MKVLVASDSPEGRELIRGMRLARRFRQAAI